MAASVVRGLHTGELSIGRGARIAATARSGALEPVRDAIRAVIDLAHGYGLTPSDVITIIEEMS